MYTDTQLAFVTVTP